VTATAAVDVAPLIAAIRAGLAAHPADLAFDEGRQPANVSGRPYIVAFFDSGTIENRSMRSRDGWSTVGTFHCAGLSPQSARVAVRALRTVILGLTGAPFAGGTLRVPEHIAGAPMDRDDDAQPVLFIQIDEWRFRLS
jgi:hypothetical protein